MDISANIQQLVVSRADGLDGDETALIRAAQANPATFDILYQRYITRVYRYLRSRTQSNEDADDLTQLVFMRAFEALPIYQPRGISFAAWLLRIAHHAAIDMHRRQRDITSWDALPVMLHPVAEINPETTVLQQEALQHLRGVLTKLDADKRELLALRFSVSLSSSEIAHVVGKSPAAVKKQLTCLLQTVKENYHALS